MSTLPPDVAVLNATRSGFVHGTYMEGYLTAGQSPEPAKMLPVNFHVDAYRAAIVSSTPGELGSYFCAKGGSCFMKRPFNGAIWMTSTWSGSMNGFTANLTTATAPSRWPTQGSLTNGSVVQPPPSLHSGIPATAPRSNGDGLLGRAGSAASQTGLPYPLCGAFTGVADHAFATKNFSSANAGAKFKIPDCASGFNGGGPRPTIVRLVSAGKVGADYGFDGGTAHGLTWGTNLSVVYVGNINTHAGDGTPLNFTGPTSTPWVPFSGWVDSQHYTSAGWSDALQPWDFSALAARNPAGTLQLNFAQVRGFMSELGNNSAGPAVIRTALAEGYRATYMDAWGNSALGFALSPSTDLSFDPHFSLMANQPPAAPLFFLGAVARLQSN
jgi:hypothetical protein